MIEQQRPSPKQNIDYPRKNNSSSSIYNVYFFSLIYKPEYVKMFGF